MLHMCVVEAHARATTENNEESHSLPTVYIAVANALLGDAKQAGAVSFGPADTDPFLRRVSESEFSTKLVWDKAAHRPVAPMDIQQVSAMNI
jgi:hypothetical protein